MMAMLRSLTLLFFIFSMGNAESYVEFVEECPYGWTNFELRCYKYFPHSVNWITAEKNCQIFGANLASVHDDLENDFLLGLLPPSTISWVGANDAIQDGEWLWSDGTVYDYTNWCSGEPNNFGGPEDCLEINWTDNHCWNDESCTRTHNYICVLDKTLFGHPTPI